MIVVNNLALGDAYSEGNTWVSLSAETITLQIFNNSAAITVFKRSPGGGQRYQEMPEQIVSPGFVTITNAVGFKAKNGSPGNIARLFFAIPEFDPQSPDPGLAGYTPTSLQVTSGGVIIVPGQEFAYQEFTAPVTMVGITEATATQIVAAPSVTFDGASPVYIEFFAPAITQVQQQADQICLYQDGASIGRMGTHGPLQPGVGAADIIHVARRMIPVAGAHIYAIRVFGPIANDVVNAGNGGSGNLMPGFIRITRAGT